MQKSISWYLLCLFWFQYNSYSKLIYSITSAYQKPAINGLISVYYKFFHRFICLYFIKTPGKSIFLSWVGMSVLPVIILIAASLVLYLKYFREIAPAIKSIKMHYAKDLISLGLQFFVIQFCRPDSFCYGQHDYYTSNRA